MEISPIEQARLMLFCALLGVVVGLLADAFSEICFVLPKSFRGVVRFISDFCCVGVTFLGITVLSFYFDKGRIRFFDFLGATLGFLLYRFALSRAVRLVFHKILSLILRLLRLLGVPCVFLMRIVKKIIKICQYYIRKAIEKSKYMLYNIYNNIILLKWAKSGFMLDKHQKTIRRRK